MEAYYINLVKTFIVVALFVITRLIINRIINKTFQEKLFQSARTQLIKKSINLILLIVSLIIILVIWGVKQSDLTLFIGSILTIVGVAFFAQWSFLSNITASIIIFFGHSVKIGDSISIMENKDYEIKGEVLDIGLFFTKLKVSDTNEEITLPNNIFIVKTIRKMIIS